MIISIPAFGFCKSFPYHVSWSHSWVESWIFVAFAGGWGWCWCQWQWQWNGRGQGKQTQQGPKLQKVGCPLYHQGRLQVPLFWCRFFFMYPDDSVPGRRKMSALHPSLCLSHRYRSTCPQCLKMITTLNSWKWWALMLLVMLIMAFMFKRNLYHVWLFIHWISCKA